MKWVTLIGRLGMVVLMTGLALGLVSLIPSVQLSSSSSSGMSSMQPDKYDFFYLWPLTPQSGVTISIESNSSVDVYLLGIEMRDFQDWTATWVVQQFPNISDYEIWQASLNVTVLDAFLESHSGAVLWKSESVTIVSKEFYPDTDVNATGIISNPSPYYAPYTWRLTQLTSLAPKTKVTLLTEILVPVGIVLAVPWVYSTRMRKPQLQ